MQISVLFLIFNRPNTTIKVFEKIRQAKPPRLYVACDGPRAGHEGEKEMVRKTREIAIKVDWPCEVKTLFRNKNLGCKKAVSTAVTWFFENEEKGIILEDDCVPHLDFFSYCENLLDYYYKNQKVKVITGNNFQNGKLRGDASYYFSKYSHCWGWASWRRAWEHYQGDMKFWPEWSNSKAWFDYMPDKVQRNYWQKIFNLAYAGEIDSWAYPWLASIWYKNGLTATPNVNLVSNIGFGKNATNTKTKNNQESNIPTQSLSNIIHPKIIETNHDADKYNFEWTYGGRNLRFPRSWIIVPKKILYFILRKIHQLIK